MSDVLDKLGQGAVVAGGSITVALVTAAYYLPKLFNGLKGDRIDGNVLDRVEKLERRSAEQDERIHKQQVRITRFVATFIKLEAYLSGKNIPQDLLDELVELTKEGD